jgi:hypothetical protein
MERVYDQRPDRVEEKFRGAIRISSQCSAIDALKRKTQKKDQHPENPKSAAPGWACVFGTKLARITYTRRRAGRSRRQTLVRREEL